MTFPVRPLPPAQTRTIFLSMPAGRPTSYRPEYCEQVVEAAREGKSLTAFAAEIDVGRQSITDWCAAHEEFSLAVNHAKALAASWYEQQARKVVENGGTGAQATLIVFGLKNMGSDDWRDKHEIEHSGGVNITISPTDADL